MKFKILSKLALLLVVFGFFQPVACDHAGFELADNLMQMGDRGTLSGIGLYVLFFAALLSVILTVVFLITKKKAGTPLDMPLLLISIAGGICTYIGFISDFSIDILNNGAYMIIVGWILSLIFLLISKKE